MKRGSRWRFYNLHMYVHIWNPHSLSLSLSLALILSEAFSRRGKHISSTSACSGNTTMPSLNQLFRIITMIQNFAFSLISCLTFDSFCVSAYSRKLRRRRGNRVTRQEVFIMQVFGPTCHIHWNYGGGLQKVAKKAWKGERFIRTFFQVKQVMWRSDNIGK